LLGPVHVEVQDELNPARRKTRHLETTKMKKTITALLAVATVAGSLSLTPAYAWRGGWGPGVAAGLIGGAIVGGAIAASRPYPYYYGPPPAYAPAYVGAPAPAGPTCVWQQQRYWDGYGWAWRPMQVC
jgi:hypothetical protein